MSGWPMYDGCRRLNGCIGFIPGPAFKCPGKKGSGFIAFGESRMETDGFDDVCTLTDVAILTFNFDASNPYANSV